MSINILSYWIHSCPSYVFVKMLQFIQFLNWQKFGYIDKTNQLVTVVHEFSSKSHQGLYRESSDWRISPIPGNEVSEKDWVCFSVSVQGQAWVTRSIRMFLAHGTVLGTKNLLNQTILWFYDDRDKLYGVVVAYIDNLRKGTKHQVLLSLEVLSVDDIHDTVVGWSERSRHNCCAIVVL